MQKLILRYNGLLLLMLLLLIPSFILSLKLIFNIKKLPPIARPDYKLHGITLSKDSPKITLNNFAKHTIQKPIENYLVEYLPFRSMFIRCSNQIYFSLFK
jgi:hypothetical protein